MPGTVAALLVHTSTRPLPLLPVQRARSHGVASALMESNWATSDAHPFHPSPPHSKKQDICDAPFYCAQSLLSFPRRHWTRWSEGPRWERIETEGIKSLNDYKEQSAATHLHRTVRWQRNKLVTSHWNCGLYSNTHYFPHTLQKLSHLLSLQLCQVVLSFTVNSCGNRGSEREATCSRASGKQVIKLIFSPGQSNSRTHVLTHGSLLPP